MARILVFEHLSLDGVMQAPGRPDEDVREGFPYGGWAAPYADEVSARIMGEGMAKPGALLLGRRTYLSLADFWPNQADNPFTPLLNERHKYVTSNTLTEPLPWVNSTLLQGEANESVARLKAESDVDLVILGSGELVRSLMEADLVDEYQLTINPLVLGSGRKLFEGSGPHTRLELIDSETTTTGVLLTRYRPA